MSKRNKKISSIKNKAGTIANPKNLSIVIMITLLILAAGCTAPHKSEPETIRLTFEVQLNNDADNQTVIRLGVANVGDTTFPGDKTFAGMMELRKETGDLQSRIEIPQFKPLPSDTSDFPTWLKAELLPGTYLLTWGAPKYGSTSVNFTIIERDGKFVIGEVAYNRRQQ